jgi:hypothetical protein
MRGIDGACNASTYIESARKYWDH